MGKFHMITWACGQSMLNHSKTQAGGILLQFFQYLMPYTRTKHESQLSALMMFIRQTLQIHCDQAKLKTVRL